MGQTPTDQPWFNNEIKAPSRGESNDISKSRSRGSKKMLWVLRTKCVRTTDIDRVKTGG